MIGESIGPYTILAKLGAGGMGEVYRAKDSKLKREVALKVLPADVANDRERMARFQREAEVLAALNHPNIKVRPDGTVKVLDVGLAKAIDQAGRAGGEAANSPTLSLPLGALRQPLGVTMTT